MLSEESEPKTTEPEKKVEPKAEAKEKHIERIIVRSCPKIVVYYPTMITAFFCGLACLFYPPDGATQTGQNQEVVKESDSTETTPDANAQAAEQPRRNTSVAEIAGEIFMIVFFFNTIVLAFEFPRLTAVAAFLLVLALVLGLVLLDRYLNLVPALRTLYGFIHISANASFYFFLAGILLFVYATTWVITRFECWEITPNELLHHHGPFGDLERFPAPSIKFDKEMPDIFEYILLRSGRLIFYPTNERRAIVLDNVIGVTSVERQIKHLLSAMEVRIDTDEGRRS